GLIVVAAIRGDGRPVRIVSINRPKDFLEAQDATKHLRSKADFVGESAFELTVAQTCCAGQRVQGNLSGIPNHIAGQANDVRSGLAVVNALHQDLLQRLDFQRQNSIRFNCIGQIASELTGKGEQVHNLICSFVHREFEERVGATRMKANPDQLHGTRWFDDDRTGHLAYEKMSRLKLVLAAGLKLLHRRAKTQYNFDATIGKNPLRLLVRGDSGSFKNPETFNKTSEGCPWLKLSVQHPEVLSPM